MSLEDTASASNSTKTNMEVAWALKS